jgi:hypothetical protein
MGARVKIEVLYFRDCPNYPGVLDQLTAVLLEEGLDPEISQIEIKDASSAEMLNCTTSPTIRINGLDMDPDFRAPSERCLACRWYPGGRPAPELIRMALRKARSLE